MKRTPPRMRPSSRDLSQLQIICALFPEETGDDLYLARQIKESIDASIETSDSLSQDDAFLNAAKRLLETRGSNRQAQKIDLVPAPAAGAYSQLALRARLLAALKRCCLAKRSVLVLAGLREAICPPGKRWTKRRKREYQDAIAYARAFCLARSRPSSQLELIVY